MTEKIHFGWPDVMARLARIHGAIEYTSVPEGDAVYGVPRGGAVVAGLLAAKYGYRVVDAAEDADIIVEDIIDSGATRERITEQLSQGPYAPQFCALVDKQGADKGIGWVVFPWEERDESADIADTVVRQLELIGEDPTREGLKDTPRRYIKALQELCSGVGQDAAAPLAKTFNEDHDEIVCVKNMPFSSLCEHHLLGFTGVVHFAYVPKGKIVGLSKIPRMLHILASRPQVQERLATQIVETFDKALTPVGVMAVIEGRHSCMSCRGVRSQGEMVTSVVRGCFKDKPEARAEALALMGVH